MKLRIKICIIFLVISLGGVIYVLLNVKQWAMSQIKTQIKQGLDAKTVTIKDLTLTFKGPIVVEGLEIKKGNDFSVFVTRIILNQGIWSLFQGSYGKVYIKSLVVNQIKIEALELGFWWKNEDLKISIEEGNLLNGTIKGKVVLRLTRVPVYEAKIELGSLSLPQFVKDFKLKDKVQIKGLLGGHIDIQGMGKNFQIIDGNLKSLGAGGELVILDTQYLETMAKRSGQSFDIIVASLKHYLYNIGRVSLTLNQGNLEFDIGLEGAAGKRKLTIVLHDFNLERFGL